MKVTLQDISAETGYSVSTISRVLRNVGKISPKAREEILKAAKKLNYPTSRITGYEQNNGILNIALITDFHEGEFYASYFYGFLNAARSENVRLSLLSVHDPREEIVTFLDELINEEHYNGAILFLPELERVDYQEILNILPTHFPVVSNAMIENPLLSTITFDNYSGGYQAAEHFYECGYQNVGIVRGPSKKAESWFRYNGFKDFVIKKPGMNLVWEYEGDFEFDSGAQSVHSLLKNQKKPEAVFVSNDLMATGFIDNAKFHQIPIPKDIAVLGYDDLPMCRHIKPEISTIRTDFERLGSATVRMFKDRMSQDGYQHGILSLIPVSVVTRESTSSKLTKEVDKQDH